MLFSLKLQSCKRNPDKSLAVHLVITCCCASCSTQVAGAVEIKKCTLFIVLLFVIISSEPTGGIVPKGKRCCWSCENATRNVCCLNAVPLEGHAPTPLALPWPCPAGSEVCQLFSEPDADLFLRPSVYVLPPASLPSFPPFLFFPRSASLFLLFSPGRAPEGKIPKSVGLPSPAPELSTLLLLLTGLW